MAYTVGEVEVNVFPNARGWDTRLSQELNPRAEVIGREVGDRIAEGIRTRMGSVGDVRIGVDTAAARAELDRFIAEMRARLVLAGQQGGNQLGQGVANGASQASPLIAAAIAGALAAGAPVATAAAGTVFGAIAALAVHSQEQIQTAYADMTAQVTTSVKSAAEVTVPFFVDAMGRIGLAVQQLQPQLASAFTSLQGPIASVTTGVIGLVQNAMPGLVAAVQSAGPVFRGLATALSDIGTGLSGFFQAISEHGAAGGQVFTTLGQALQALLPALGQLVGAGAELAAVVLPPLASALGAVSSVLSFMSPVLPGVVAGILGLMAARMVAPMLATLATNLATTAAAAGPFAGAAGLGSRAAAGLGAALPGLAIAVGLVGAAFSAESKKTDDWARALNDGGKAAADAAAAMRQHAADGEQWSRIFDKIGSRWNDGIAQMKGYADANDEVRQKQKALYDAMSPLEKRQQDLTAAQNDYSYAVNKWGINSGQAVAAAMAMRDADAAVTTQKAIVDGALQQNAFSLDAISKSASQASQQIGLLKTSLDVLTGGTVTTMAAEAAFTQAVDSAKTATQNQAGALIDANGQLNLHTAAGAAAFGALQQVASGANQVIAAMINQGATTAEVTARDGQLRDSFIQTAQNMGFSAGQAQNLANQIYGIPGERQTRINADIGQATAAIDIIRAQIAGIPNRTIYINTIQNAGPAAYTNAFSSLNNAEGRIAIPMASGGITAAAAGIADFYPPNQPRLIGDNPSVPEAYIPINNSARSLQILTQTASRMGYALDSLSGASGGSAGASGRAAPSRTVNGQVFNAPVTITDTDEQSARAFRHAAMADARFQP
ncbi:MAG: LigA protein [Streptosporangiaceae bacterium]|nr:LigA protein [Streptosporangiaceae bacterium]